LASTELVDPSWKGLYMTGGVSAFIYGILLFVGLTLLFILGQPPAGGQEFLNYYAAGREPLGRLAFGLFGISDLMTVPVMLAVYAALRGVNRSAMLVASAFFGLFIVLDLGVNVLNNLSLITLAEHYAAVTSPVQQASYVATADYILATLNVAGPIYGFVFPSIWGLVVSLIMLKGIFSRRTAYVGLAASILGIIGGTSVIIPSAGAMQIFSLILFGIWFPLLGSKLRHLGRR
jgi:hypothetical protein